MAADYEINEKILAMGLLIIVIGGLLTVGAIINFAQYTILKEPPRPSVHTSERIIKELTTGSFVEKNDIILTIYSIEGDYLGDFLLLCNFENLTYKEFLFGWNTSEYCWTVDVENKKKRSD